jgi:hypothetical protein
MRIHLDKWEDERIDAHNEECFNQVFESFFDQEDLEFYGTDDILWEIEELQKRYHMFADSGYDMEEILDAPDEDIINVGYPMIPDDPFFKDLFVTKHQIQRRRSRNGKRVMGKQDSPMGVECILLRIEV